MTIDTRLSMSDLTGLMLNHETPAMAIKAAHRTKPGWIALVSIRVRSICRDFSVRDPRRGLKSGSEQEPPDWLLMFRPMNDVERAEGELSVRKIGLYIGPMILGSVAAGSVYRSVCGGRYFVLAGFMDRNFIWNLTFALLASMLAWSLREPRARLAFAVFAVQQAALSYGSILGAPINPWLSGILSVAFAVLLTFSSIPTQPKWRVVAPAVFTAMFLLRWITLFYADSILGRHSVFRSSPFC